MNAKRPAGAGTAGTRRGKPKPPMTERQLVKLATEQYSAGFADATESACALLELAAQGVPEARTQADMLMLVLREIERAATESFPAAIEAQRAGRPTPAVVIRPREAIERDLRLRREISARAIAAARAAIERLFAPKQEHKQG